MFQIAQFNVYVTTVESIFPLFLSFYMGAWADIFGRRTILYVWAISALLGQAGIMLTAIFMEWPKEIYLIAELPKAVLGKIFFCLNITSGYFCSNKYQIKESLKIRYPSQF